MINWINWKRYKFTPMNLPFFPPVMHIVNRLKTFDLGSTKNYFVLRFVRFHSVSVCISFREDFCCIVKQNLCQILFFYWVPALFQKDLNHAALLCSYYMMPLHWYALINSSLNYRPFFYYTFQYKFTMHTQYYIVQSLFSLFDYIVHPNKRSEIMGA